MSDRWLDGSTRPADVAAGPLAAVLERLLGGVTAIERVPSGVSTPVYRADRHGETVFVRLAEQPGGSMDVEAAAHEYLRALGVAVPDVLAVDPGVEVGRGLMVISEVPGRPLATSDGVDPAPILRAAGADLARINGVQVDGFGWIQRAAAAPPFRGVHPSYRTFVEDGARGVHDVAAATLDAPQVVLLTDLLDAVAGEHPEPRLSHGDFDGTHIYQQGGSYAGVIDLGEMRGAEPWYDLAFALVQDRSTVPALVAGYRDVTPVPADLPRLLVRSAAVIVATQLGRWYVRDGPDALGRRSGRWWTSRLRELVDELASWRGA